MEKNKEIRSTRGLEIQSDNASENSRKVGGYAIRFNEESEDLGFYETIDAGAITQEYVDSHDIFAFYNHDSEKVLARSINGEGTLKLEVRDDGVYYEFEAPHTVAGDELLEHIKRGELFGSSFCFTVPEDRSGEHWAKDDDGNYHRLITHINDLYEVSPVFQPAYRTSSCNMRSKEQVKKFDELLKGLDKTMDEIEELAKY